MHIQKWTVAALLICVYPSSYAEEEISCLAKNIYFESRDQPWIGQVAVAQATLNRVKDSRFPNTVCRVVKQRKNRICQFSWYCDGLSDTPKEKERYKEAMVTATYVYKGELPDVTEGSLWYHALTVKPWWAKAYKRTVSINGHIFYTRP